MEDLVQIPLWIIQMFGCYILASTFAFIWWAATITEKLNNANDKLEDFNNSNFAKKEDVDKELGRIQGSIDKAHNRIDELKLKGA